MMNLMFGDCLERMKEIPDSSIDCVLTDPPYGTTACKWDSIIPFEPMWEQLKRITKDNGAICLFGSEPFSSNLRMSNIKMFKYDWYWNKKNTTGFFMAKRQPIRHIELISIFYKNQPTYNPQFEILGDNDYRIRKNGKLSKARNIEHYSHTKELRKKENGKRYPKHLIEFNNTIRGNNRLHPTQKPVTLLEYLIKTYTLENETVLDFTMGSGSTGVACKNLKRNFIGIEKDENYFEIAKKRIENA